MVYYGALSCSPLVPADTRLIHANTPLASTSFPQIKTQEQVENLQHRIAPHLLRRVKEDVAKDIPPKEETIIDVELTTLQKQYYRAIFERNLGVLKLAKGIAHITDPHIIHPHIHTSSHHTHSHITNHTSYIGNMPKLMNIQMELRKCCNHPFLVHGVEDREYENLETGVTATKGASTPPLYPPHAPPHAPPGS